MKRAWFAVLLFFGSGIIALFWFGHYFTAYLSSADTLYVKPLAERSLLLGEDVCFDLHGSGFDRNTVVSMSLDIHNSEAVVSFPLEGVFNESLLDDELLYLASDEGGLQVLNIADLHHPKVLKQYLVGWTIIDIQRSGDYLFLCGGKLGIAIMQIQPNGSLKHIREIHFDAKALKSYYFNGFLYVAAGSAGLLIYDVRQADQADQVELVEVVNRGTCVSDLAVIDGNVYLAVAPARIEVYQLEDPRLPLLVGSLELSNPIHDLLSHRGQLYVATADGVSLYGPVATGQPELLHQWTQFGLARKLFAGMRYIYVSDGFYGLRVIGTDMEHSPGFINLNIDPRTVSETTDHIIIGGSHKGLLIIAKEALAVSCGEKHIDTLGNIRDLFLKDGWLYTAAARGGVVLRHLDTERRPALKISSRRAESFAVHQERLYVANAKDGIEIFDISVPGAPESVAIWPELQVIRMTIAGNYLVSTQGIGGVKLIDISTINHPVVKDELLDIHALDVTSDGHFIYIASKTEGLLIYTITADATLHRLSNIVPPFPLSHFSMAVAIQVHDDIAYIANGRSGLLIVDVSRPSHPTILSSITIPGSCIDLMVLNEKVYISSHHGGITVVSVADPKQPRRLHNIAIPGVSRGTLIDDGLIYITQQELGISILPVPIVAKIVDVFSPQQIRIKLPSPRIPGRYSLQINNRCESVVVDGVADYQ